ncbi:MAG: N-acetylglucosamine-6-phosphate deacetylase, partial [Bacteroidota bacterium]|nr:N-acetylglucosamine-6-phosphate deacetylase [Bacteroidota bacterium]
YGKLLAAYPEPESLSLLNKYCNEGGAAFCLPTVATNTQDVFFASIDAIRNYWGKGGEGILGLHIEGPWINPSKRGAHAEEHIHSPKIEEVNKLLNYGKGVIRMITLAPEVCSSEIIELIHLQNIIISAGHSNATHQEAAHSFKHGISTVTHLYNAMSPLHHRHPGLTGAALNDEAVMASIIADGHHVDYAAIRIAKKIMKERLFVITDAVTETTTGYYPHKLVGDKYESNGILSGSALTMIKALQNLVIHVGIDLEEALRMCSLYPAKVIAMEKKLGKIEKGYKAKMVVLSKELEVAKLLN